MTLQRILVISILCLAVVTTREASSRLGVLLSFMLISLHDLFCATGDGFTSDGFVTLYLQILAGTGKDRMCRWAKGQQSTTAAQYSSSCGYC